MDLKFKDFDKIPKKYQIEVYKLAEHLLNTTKFEKMYGKEITYGMLLENDKKILNMSIIKRKTCYTVYISYLKK